MRNQTVCGRSDTYRVGDTARLTKGCLGNPSGAIGVCYEVYQIGDLVGASFIFPNGNYDGFSAEEQAELLEPVGHEPGIADYRFENVIRLTEDFRMGRFAAAFQQASHKNQEAENG